MFPLWHIRPRRRELKCDTLGEKLPRKLSLTFTPPLIYATKSLADGPGQQNDVSEMSASAVRRSGTRALWTCRMAPTIVLPEGEAITIVASCSLQEENL